MTDFPAGSVLLDDSADPGAASLLFRDPVEIVRVTETAAVPAALDRLSALSANGLHLAGYLSYELGLLFEDVLAPLATAKPRPDGPEMPLLWFGAYAAPRRLAAAEAMALIDALAGDDEAELSHIAPLVDFFQYSRAFETVQAYIAAGDCYQVNLTFPVEFTLGGSPFALYRQLVRKQRTAFGALIDAGDHIVLSRSPELFVRRDGNRLEARPMKGTAERGRTLEEDQAGRLALARDEKNRAENLMITDLIRNDLGRIAEIGSVAVPELFGVETLGTVHQMSSIVTATPRPGVDFTAMLRALFPCGSITGAPKIRAMEIINEVEPHRRGLYTGAIGHVAPNGDFCFNVAIRTAMIGPDGRGRIGIGGGIVADSTLGEEHEEALLKLRFLTDPPLAFDLIETLLWERGQGYALLERHLDRLAGSARYFARPVDLATVRAALADAASEFAGDRQRVRLLLDENGTASVTATPITAPMERLRFAVAAERQSSTDRFLYHKTTQRQGLDGPRAAAQQALGVDEVVFLNERDELTEGSYMSLFVERDGRLLTPALHCGLLPGTLRAELLETGAAEEAVLTLNDLDAADRILLGNSVRGLVPADYVRDDPTMES